MLLFNHAIAFLLLMISHRTKFFADATRSFVIIMERSDLTCDANYAVNCSSSVRKFNRTSPYLLNVHADIIKPIGRNISLVFKSFEWKNNQFKQSFISFEKNICDFIEKDAWLISMIKLFANIPDKCPIMPGAYSTKNLMIYEDYFPQNFPISRWKFVYFYKSVSDSKILASMEVQFKVEHIYSGKEKKKKATVVV